jgi:hypothetical protein
MTEDTTTPDTEAEAPTTNAPKLVAGFAVLIDEGGNVFIEKSPSVFTVPVEREATLIEVRRYTSEILMDLQAQASAEYSAIRIAAIAEEAKAAKNS